MKATYDLLTITHINMNLPELRLMEINKSGTTS